MDAKFKITKPKLTVIFLNFLCACIYLPNLTPPAGCIIKYDTFHEFFSVIPHLCWPVSIKTGSWLYLYIPVSSGMRVSIRDKIIQKVLVYMNQNLAIVVPCYNEANRLKTDLFLAFATAHQHITFWFVNDGSHDNTTEVLQHMQEQNHRQIQLLILDQNVGKAEAVRLGIMNVVKDAAFDYVGFLDADLSAPLFEINHLHRKLQQYPNTLIASGSRVKLVGRTIERSAMRHFLSRIFVTFYANLLHIPNYDTQCGLKLFERELAGSIFDQPFVSKWLFDIELFIRTKARIGMDNYRLQVKEVPLFEWKEVSGSKLKLFDFIYAPIEVLKIYTHYKKHIKS